MNTALQWAAGGVFAVLALAFGIDRMYTDKALPGTSIGPLAVGGMSEKLISETVAKRSAQMTEIRLTDGDAPVVIPAEQVGLKVDPEASARAAVVVGKSNFLSPLWQTLKSAAGGQEVTVRYELNEPVLRERIAAATQGRTTPAVNATVVRQGTTFRITREQAGSIVDPAANAQAVRRALERFTSQLPLYTRTQQPDIRAATLGPARAYAEYLATAPFEVRAGDRVFRPGANELAGWVSFHRYDENEEGISGRSNLIGDFDALTGIGQTDQPIIASVTRTLRAGINHEAVGRYVAEVAGEVDRPPVNAQVEFVNDQLQISGAARDGLVVDRKAAVTAISEAMRQPTRRAALAVVSKPADIRPETLPKLGIVTRIGVATTTFAGSPPNRTYNIGVGARRFDGVLIKPGEDFSFNAVLGDVGPETGYLPELVIKENKTVPEYGGGLCQVSTTMFRAALNAGLPITARTNHSYAVHYYAPIGLDATIYPPNPDMRFRNNTGKHILVQTRQAGTSVTFEFFGTADGRKSSTQIIHINASEEAGGTASFRYVVEGGPEPINRVFSSTYLPRSKFPVDRSLN